MDQWRLWLMAGGMALNGAQLSCGEKQIIGYSLFEMINNGVMLICQ